MTSVFWLLALILLLSVSIGPIYEYRKSKEMERSLIPNGSIYSSIVESMGGDPPREITEEQCLQELRSLEDREYLCGAYWMFKQLHPDRREALHELSMAKDRDEMVAILKKHSLQG